MGFLVTNLPLNPEEVFAFYNQRGTAEQHIKEGKIALKWTRLSCRTMAQNEVRLQLHALAYNLGMFLGSADLPDEVASWSLRSLQTRLIKIGARVVRHARTGVRSYRSDCRRPAGSVDFDPPRVSWGISTVIFYRCETRNDMC